MSSEVEPIRIGIDIRKASGQRTGVGSYVYKLLKSLEKIDKKNSYYYFPRKSVGLWSTTSFLSSLYAIYQEFLWKQLILPFHIARLHIDIFFSPNPIIPFFVPCKNVVKIHDLEVPAKTRPFAYLWFLLTALSARRASKIIVPSENTKRDIARIFNTPKDKIVVIYDAPDERFKPLNQELPEKVREKYVIKGKFILAAVGTFIPRKNVCTLLFAYARLPRSLKAEYQLVLIGNKRGSEFKKCLDIIDKMNLNSRVVLTGYVSDDDVHALYNSADLFVFPSLHEGFGLPPLEAMACGVPVIASKRASMPEVVGNAGILINPLDVNGLSDAMKKVLSDDSLRRSMRQGGLTRAQLFSVKRTAEETISLFEQEFGRNGFVES